MREREVLASRPWPIHPMRMGDKKQVSRTPREMLEWLFGETQYIRWRAGKRTLNTKKLADDMRARLGSGSPSQSTLHRMYSKDTREVDSSTLSALEEFTGAPVALIRGEVYLSAAETFGMDITAGDARLLRALRELKDDQRRAIYEQIRAMLPDDKKHLVPRLPEPTVVLKFRPKQES